MNLNDDQLMAFADVTGFPITFPRCDPPYVFHSFNGGKCSSCNRTFLEVTGTNRAALESAASQWLNNPSESP